MSGRIMGRKDGTGIPHPYDGDCEYACRPLVVIDPEDREQARALLQAYGDQFTGFTPALDGPSVERLQAALRSLVTPTKPDEPTEWGALARERDGTVWMRCRDGEGDGFAWATRDSQAKWSQLDIVETASFALPEEWSP